MLDSPESRKRAAAWAGLVLLAALLRFAGLDLCPPGIFRDEAEKGYNAWALANSGSAIEFPVDEARRATGERWRRFPFLIEVMGVKTSAVYQYASVPFVSAFGLGAGSARMAAALAGTLAVAALGALLLRLWPAPYALAAMLWFALCPWHILFSRWALEGIFVPLAMAGALAGLAAIERERAWGGALLGFSLGFAFYAYSGAQPFVLAWGAALAALHARRIRGKPMILLSALAAFALFAAPRAWVIISEGGDRRLAAIAVWGADEGEAAPGFIQIAARFIANYLAHFNPIFLFVRGDSLPRHGIPGLGQLLLIDAFLLPLGAITAWRRNLPLTRALLLAFLLGPIGAAITRIGIPHALRALPMALPAAVLSGVGLAAAAQWIRARPIPRAGLYAALFALVCTAYAGRVYGNYWQRMRGDAEAQVAFALPERRAFEEIFRERRGGEAVYIDGRLPYAPYFALFYGKLSPEKMKAGGLPGAGINFFNAAASAPDHRFAQLAPGDWLLELDAMGLPLLRRKPPGAAP